jgi:hypothetical protein
LLPSLVAPDAAEVIGAFDENYSNPNADAARRF